MNHVIDGVVTYTWGRLGHAKNEPQWRSSILLFPFGTAGEVHSEGVVRCKLAHMSHVPKVS